MRNPYAKVFVIIQLSVILFVWLVYLRITSLFSGTPTVVVGEVQASQPHETLHQVNHPRGRLYVPHPPLPATLRAHDWDTLTPENVGDRSFLVLLGHLVNVNDYPKRILYDLGLRDYESSLEWMLDHYPAHFDEVYGFECEKTVFKDKKDPRIPEGGAHYYLGTCVGTEDGENTIDFPRLLHETCRMQDFCLVKMDIEGTEWPLLAAMEERGVHALVDELLVEVHFLDPHMTRYKWDQFGPQRIEDAHNLLNHWRHDLHVYTNPWP